MDAIGKPWARTAPHVVLLLALLGCADDGPQVPAPDFSGAETAVVTEVERLREQVQRAPRSGTAWGMLADRLMAHGWRREAAACYAQAERLQPDRFDWPYMLGHALALRDIEGAAAAFSRAVALDGSYVPARIHLAETWIRLDRFEDARAQYLQALRVDPDNVDALLGVSRLDLDTGRYEQAVARLERAYRIDPEPSELHHALAHAYLIVGKNELARRFAASARDAPPRKAMDDPRRERALPADPA